MARYNPPPSWPQPPAGWTPPPGWAPDPSWGPPPPGWPVWLPDAATGPTQGPAAPQGHGSAPAPGRPGTPPLLWVAGGVVLAVVLVGGAVLLTGGSGSDAPATVAAPVPTTTATAPTTTTRATTTTPADPAGSDTLEGAFPMIGDGDVPCRELAFDPAEWQSAEVPERAVVCDYTDADATDGSAVYLQWPSVAAASDFGDRTVPGGSRRSWLVGDENRGPELDWTTPSGFVVQELSIRGSRYVAVARERTEPGVETVFRWVARETLPLDEMPG